MTFRSIYLAKNDAGARRDNFAIFIPDAEDDRIDVAVSFRQQSTKGTIIQVIGEPVMAGYFLEFQRKFECQKARDLKQLIYLGKVDEWHLYKPPRNEAPQEEAPEEEDNLYNQTDDPIREDTPRCRLEWEATKVPPPPGGQNARAPIDGVNTRRCQEWTVEYLHYLSRLNLIDVSAVYRAEAERDPPGYGLAVQAPRR